MLYEQETIEYIASLPSPTHNYIRLERYTEGLRRICNCIAEKMDFIYQSNKTSQQVLEAYQKTGIEELKEAYNQLVNIAGDSEYIDNMLITCRIEDQETKDLFYEVRSLLCRALDKVLSDADKQIRSYVFVQSYAADPMWNVSEYLKKRK